MQEKNKTRSHRSAWKCLMTIDIIGKYFITAKVDYLKGQYIEFFDIVINSGLSLTQNCYKLIIENFIYITTIDFYYI